LLSSIKESRYGLSYLLSLFAFSLYLLFLFICFFSLFAFSLHLLSIYSVFALLFSP